MREMKDSGVEWIGEIPKDWKLERLQWHLEEIVEKNDSIVTTQVLSLTNKKGVIPYEEKGAQGNVAKESYDGYKIAYPNTIVANSMNILIGSVGYSNFYGCVSPVYYVFKEREDNDLRYINYIMQTTQFQKELRKYANGILEIRLRVSAANILKRFCAFPDYEEQSNIADYLDSKCSQIDAIIEKQRAIIERLKEYKSSVITEAVTKGLSPDVEMKDSGYDFIGKIQKSWILSKLKYLSLEIGDGIHTTPEYDSNGEYYFMNGQNIGADSLVFNDKTDKLNEREFHKYKQPFLSENTIFITLNGATYGKTSFYNGEKVLLGKSAGYITLKQEENKNYVRYYLQSRTAKTIMELSLCGSTIANLSLKTLNNFYIPLPDSEEQIQIVKYLDKKCGYIDKKIDGINILINKLQEYKKSLIYEVVTGKKEV